MANLLFHITTGPENVNRAALGLLVAKTAMDEGHEITVFFAGDGVDWLRPETRDGAAGVGLGDVGQHYAGLASGSAELYGSGLSAKARGVTSDGSVELVPPPRLVELIVGADKVVVY